MAVCAVNAVPTKRASTISLSDVEKTPESAITAAPQSSKKGTRTEVGEQKNTGDATQHAPLITSAHTAADFAQTVAAFKEAVQEVRDTLGVAL